MTGRVDSKKSRQPHKLPVRIRVPERNDLIAYGLATLAMGLMIGLALSPFVRGSTSLPVIIPSAIAPEGDAAEETIADVAPALGSPAGSDTPPPAGPEDTLVASNDVPVSDPPAPVVEDPDTPEAKEPEPTPATDPPEPTPDPDPVPEGKGVPLSGVVLANSPSSRTYWVESSGDLVTVFAATVPDPGLAISTRVLPLSNGTLTESAIRSAVDIKKSTTLRGVVSYVDPVAGVTVLSSRGASLPMIAPDPATVQQIKVGDQVEAGLTLDVPDPQALMSPAEAEAAAPLPELPIKLEQVRRIAEQPTVELTGKLISVDPEAGTLTFSPDSTGLLASEIAVGVPEGFPFEIVAPGRLYSLTASTGEELLRLVGISPATGKAAANDPARAFGTHAG